MADAFERIASQFEQDYVPLDPALVRVILYDYDVSSSSDATQLANVRQFLDTLKSSALEDDAASFDPTGTSGVEASPSAATGNHISDRSTDLVSETTDTTNLSNDVSLLSLQSDVEDDKSVSNEFEAIEKQDDTTKAARLAELFPKEKPSDIRYILQKSNGNFSRSMDILLNQVFLGEEAGTARRGIDGFSEDMLGTAYRKKKGKKKKFQSLDDASYEEENESLVQNVWSSARSDIDFIALHTGLPEQQISSIYHKNGASRFRTIRTLLDFTLEQDSSTEDQYLAEDGVLELLYNFPLLPPKYAAAVVRLTRPSTANAHQLAKALTSKPSSGATTPLRIVPHYAPFGEEKSPTNARISVPSSPLLSTATLASARNTNFDKAAHYYRKGKSDNLMGGAAAYYSQLGRDANVALKSATAAEADALVASQSTATQLDLHGITVKDAVRIAREKVTRWWHGLGESRLVRIGGSNGVGAGYRIVTGIGRHSDGGIGKIGPAVARMLVREGWKVEVGSGVLIVTGVARRK